MIYWQLFLSFFKTGLFSVGGGLATLPFLYEIADRYGWFTKQMLSDMLAVSESTPGPIGVNMATYAGFVTKGVSGALMATFALVIPSVIVILLVAKFMKKFRENPLVQHAFEGIRPAVVAIVAVAVLEVVRVSVLNLPAYEASHQLLDLVRPLPIAILAVFLVITNVWKKLHPIAMIALGAAIGIVMQL